MKYSVNEEKSTITLTESRDMSENPIKKYKINKTDNGYTFKPLNTGAKDWGTMTLEPKK